MPEPAGGAEPDWLPEDEVEEIHNREVVRFPGRHGLRSPDGLAAAVVRPANRFYYEGETSLPRLAALYAVAIIRNHPYVDGNKRTGWTLAEAFLNRNGMTVKADDEEIFNMLINLAQRALSEEDFSQWLESRSHPSRPAPNKI